MKGVGIHARNQREGALLLKDLIIVVLGLPNAAQSVFDTQTILYHSL